MSITEEEAAAMFAYNPGFTPGTSASSNLNLLQDIYSMSGSPVFAYQQGLITPGMLLDMIKAQTKTEVMKGDDVDYKSIEQRAQAVGDEVLLAAYQQIKDGMALSGVKRWLIREWGKGGLSTQEEAEIEALFETGGDLNEYERRIRNAESAFAKTESGEWTQDALTGNYLGSMNDADASAVLKSFGFTGLLAQPAFWKTIPDEEYAKKSVADLAAAETKYNEMQKLQSALTQKSMGAANQAYADFMKQIPETGATRSQQQLANEQNLKKAPEMGTREYQEMISRGAESYMKGGAYMTAGGPSAGATAPPTPALPGNTNQAIMSRLTPQEREYWAKMAQSYAGRGVQSQGIGKVSAAKTETDRLIASSDENKKLAMEKGITPALALLAQAPKYAAQLSTPAPRAQKAKPRVLSDQEIDSMANMIAGGFAG